MPDSVWASDPFTGELMRPLYTVDAVGNLIPYRSEPAMQRAQKAEEPLYRRFLHGVKDAVPSTVHYIKEHGWRAVPDAAVAAAKGIVHGTANAGSYLWERKKELALAGMAGLVVLPAAVACIGGNNSAPTPDIEATVQAKVQATIAALAPTATPTAVPPSELVKSIPPAGKVEKIPFVLKSIDDMRSEFRRTGCTQCSSILGSSNGTYGIVYDFRGNDQLIDAIVIGEYLHQTRDFSTNYAKFDFYENTGISLKQLKTGSDNSVRIPEDASPDVVRFGLYRVNNRLIFLVEEPPHPEDSVYNPDIAGLWWLNVWDAPTNTWRMGNLEYSVMFGNFDTDPDTELAALDYSTPIRIYELGNESRQAGVRVRLVENEGATNATSLAIKDFARAQQKGDREDLRLLWKEHGPAASLTALSLLGGFDVEYYRSAVQAGLTDGRELPDVISDMAELSRAERALLQVMQSGDKTRVRAAVQAMWNTDSNVTFAAFIRIGGQDVQQYVSRISGLEVANIASDLTRGRMSSAAVNAAMGNYSGALFDVLSAFAVEKGAAAAVGYIDQHENLSPFRVRDENTTYMLDRRQIDRDLLTDDERKAFESGGVISVSRMDEIKKAQEARDKEESFWESWFGGKDENK